MTEATAPEVEGGWLELFAPSLQDRKEDVKLLRWVSADPLQLLEALPLVQDIPRPMRHSQPWPGHVPGGAIQLKRVSGFARGCLAPSKEPVLAAACQLIQDLKIAGRTLCSVFKHSFFLPLWLGFKQPCSREK